MVVSTSSASRLELTASPTSARASSWSTRRVSSVERGLEVVEQLDVAQRQCTLCREGGQQEATRSSKGATMVRQTVRTPITSSSTSIGAPRMVR